MGIKLTNGYIINNLEGQVEYNKKNIEKHFEVDRVLANFGIKIIGRVDTAEDIAEQPVPVGGYQYGDAYAVGEEGTVYDYYIYTRPFEGEVDDQWFNIGKLSIVGPQGPQGEPGETGAPGPSTRWYTISKLNNEATTEPKGTMLLEISTANVYESNGTSWKYKVNIRGPQGIQGNQGPAGPQGAQGPQGPVGAQGARGLGLVILGTDLASVDNLPSPTSVRRDGAYLVGNPKHLWAITGTTELQWEDLGAFNATPSLPEGKLYMHNCSIRFNIWGGTTINFNPIYSTNPERITKDNYKTYPGVVWNTNELHYGDGSWQLVTKFNYFPDWGGDPAWVLEGVQFYNDTTYGTVGTFNLTEYGDIINTIYDGVVEV